MGRRRGLKEVVTSLDHRPGEGQRPQSRRPRARESQLRQSGALETGAAAPTPGSVAGTSAADIAALSGSGRGAWSQTELGSQLPPLPLTNAVISGTHLSFPSLGFIICKMETTNPHFTR